MTTPLKIVFMGTPQFSVATAQSLYDAGHDIICVYSQPPRPAGRGKKIQKTAVHMWAENLGIPVRTPKSLKDPAEQQNFADLGADVGVVVAYGLLLPQAILDAPKMGCVNVHASLLPRWRGAAPIHRAIQAGDTQTGVVIMQMDAGLDTGDMILWDSVPITESTTCGNLHDTLAKMGGDLINPALNGMANGTITPTPQPDDGITYAHKITKDESLLDFTQPAETLHRQIRAFNPHPTAYFTHNGERIKVLSAEIIPDNEGNPAGTVINETLTIACGTEAIKITKAQRAGKKPMDTKTFLMGYKIKPKDPLNQ